MSKRFFQLDIHSESLLVLILAPEVDSNIQSHISVYHQSTCAMISSSNNVDPEALHKEVSADDQLQYVYLPLI